MNSLRTRQPLECDNKDKREKKKKRKLVCLFM